MGLQTHARKAWKGAGLPGKYTHWGYGAWGAGYGCGFVGIAGMIGVEYNFKFPLQISIDYRPVIGPCFYTKKFEDSKYYKNVDFYYSGLVASAFTLGIRYKF
jgi:hypothetical protein